MADELDFQKDLVYVDWAVRHSQPKESENLLTDFDLAESVLQESMLIQDTEKIHLKLKEKEDEKCVKNRSKKSLVSNVSDQDSPMLLDPAISPSLNDDETHKESEKSNHWVTNIQICLLELKKIKGVLGRPWKGTPDNEAYYQRTEWPHLFVKLPRWEDLLFSFLLFSSVAYLSTRMVLKTSAWYKDPGSVSTRSPIVSLIQIPTPTTDLFVIHENKLCQGVSHVLEHSPSQQTVSPFVAERMERILHGIEKTFALSPRSTATLRSWVNWGFLWIQKVFEYSQKALGSAQKLAKQRLKIWKARFSARVRHWKRD